MNQQRPFAVVTGACRGLGRAYAEELARRRYDLLLVDQPGAPLDETSTSLKAQHEIAIETVAADLSEPEEVAAVAAQVGALPRLDLLVNNAGYMIVGKIDELALERMERMIQLHAVTVLTLSRAAVEKMRPAKKGGIINVSSIAGFSVAREYAAYNGTKAFIQMFTRCLALEVEGSGIHVLAVCPGPMQTSIFEADDAPKLLSVYSPSAIIWTHPQKVVEGSLARLGKKVVWVPGVLNKLIVATSSFNAKIVDRFT